MEDDAAHGDDHVDAQFEQPLAQPRDLGVRTRGARGPQAEFLHEDVRGGREEHAQLIRPEATATRAADLKPVVQFLDPILPGKGLARRRRAHRPVSSPSPSELLVRFSLKQLTQRVSPKGLWVGPGSQRLSRERVGAG